ncbi:glycoside hydrolase family 3 C-terminal domain-containing protein [Sanguibacter sp. 4.1]|uniref:beta-glucosidase n=1 Tax=Sanguibacter biliveldensis TaxID=3030830 RepID=A0AAF0Z8L6_9MICO|nr:glycoside hydrolase family 3 N-terminal domain-containing protein [Sanguibacter sp. 4.1]WPF82799.1 glycoside hydrolase family 3 C-terminal domain-containing protein [Sanguibacter sp. 4.1]
MPTPLTTLTAPDGTVFRDLDKDGVMAPFEDPREPVEARVDDLLGRMTLEEKAGLMFQTVIETSPDGSLVEQTGAISKSPTTVVVQEKLLNHFNVHVLPEGRLAARWHNNLQALAEQTRLGIPVTVSTDPRHAFHENTGASFAAGFFSQWPDSLGLAAIGDAELVREFADAARQEYLSVGIRAALHPCVDLATEPRWARQLNTFGETSQLVSDFTAAHLDGFQGPGGELTAESVACTTKHFPGGGPQKDGEDAHFPYGREQVYTGGTFEEHLAPFKVALEHKTSAMMPYYGMPVDLVVDGEQIEEVGFGYNKQIVTGLLREKMGFDGVVVTDWELVNDNKVATGQVLPARAWGVEHLDAPGRMEKIIHAGCDQFGGEECPDLLVQLVREGRVTEDRIDASVRRLLRVKFELGLFDDPYVDEDAAEAIVGRADLVAAGLSAQSRSVTVLKNGDVDGRPVLPLGGDRRVYVMGMSAEEAARLGTVVTDPAEADVAVVRVNAPWEHRDSMFLEAYFHQGSLDFSAETVAEITALAAQVPVVLDVMLDRPAILTPLVDVATAIVGTYGTSDPALVAALTGEVAPEGRLPFQLPRSMEAVAASRPDVASDTADAVFEAGHGLRI